MKKKSLAQRSRSRDLTMFVSRDYYFKGVAGEIIKNGELES